MVFLKVQGVFTAAIIWGDGNPLKEQCIDKRAYRRNKNFDCIPINPERADRLQ